VSNCAEKTGLVNIETIKSLIDQVNLRVKMLMLEIKHSGLELEDDEEGMYCNALFELAKCEPASIESQLAEQGQVLDVIDEKLNHVTSSMESF